VCSFYFQNDKKFQKQKMFNRKYNDYQLDVKKINKFDKENFAAFFFFLKSLLTHATSG